MSSAVNDLGTFDPNQYKAYGTNNEYKQRMAGDYLQDFANANANDKKDSMNKFSYTGNNGTNYGTRTEKMLFGNSQSSQDGSKSVITTENTVGKTPANSSSTAAPSNAVSSGPVTYNPEQYKYYKSASGTGSEAYAKDMEKYNQAVEDNAGNRHMGLVVQMMHPDWSRSQTTGGGNPLQEIDWSQPAPKSKMDLMRERKQRMREGHQAMYAKR